MVITSKEDICNLALVKNGAKVITDIDSLTDPGAILMKVLYDAALWMLLSESSWMFATSRINGISVGGSTVEIADLSAWAADTGYAYGTSVKELTTTDNVYYCIETHSLWAAGNYYKVGNYVTYGTNVYICILNNYSTAAILPTDVLYWTLTGTSADTNPKSGADKATFWQELTESDSAGVYDVDIVANAWSTWNLNYIYQAPPDMMMLIGWSTPGGIVRQEGKYLLSDSLGLGFLYTYFNENISEYPPHFVQTFVDKLRADSALQLTGSNAKAEALTKFWLEESLPRAKSKDSQGETPLAPKKNAWTDAKYVGWPSTGQRKPYYR